MCANGVGVHARRMYMICVCVCVCARARANGMVVHACTYMRQSDELAAHGGLKD